MLFITFHKNFQRFFIIKLSDYFNEHYLAFMNTLKIQLLRNNIFGTWTVYIFIFGLSFLYTYIIALYTTYTMNQQPV